MDYHFIAITPPKPLWPKMVVPFKVPSSDQIYLLDRNTWYNKHFELLPQPPYSPDLGPSDYWLFADLKRIIQEKRFGSNDEAILEAEVYFEAKDKSFYKKSI